MKIAINKCFGGFSLSEQAYKSLGLKWDGYGYKYNDKRTNPKLIKVIEKIGEEMASGKNAKIKIVEIPDNIGWEISEYDGTETVHEKHRSW